jgi:hypothetical protein
VAYNKFQEGDILRLKKNYTAPLVRCKIKNVILNTGYNQNGKIIYSRDGDYYAIEAYPNINNNIAEWIDMSSAHVIYELDVKTHRKFKLEQLNKIK